MRIFSILALSLLLCAPCAAQNKIAFLEADPSTFEQTLDKFPTLYNSEDWKLINQKAETLFKNQEYSQADNYSSKARILAEKLQDNLLIARSYHHLGKIQTQLLEYEKAKEFFLQAALNYARTEKTHQNKLEAGFLLKDFAFLYSNPEFITKSQDLNTALFYLFQAYKVANTNPGPPSEDLRIQTSLQIAVCFGIKGDFFAQIVWLEKVLNEIPKTPDDSSPYLFDAYLGLQSAYRAIGSYEDAFQNLSKLGVWLKSAPQDHQRKLNYLRNLADFYTQVSADKKSETTVNEGIALSKSLNNFSQLANFYSAKLLKSLEAGKFKEANESLILLEDISKRDKLAVNGLDLYVGKAVIAGYKSERAKSEEYFRQAKKALEEDGGERSNTLFLLFWESKIALFQKDYEKLKSISEKYLDAATGTNNKDSLPLALINLAKSYAGIGNLPEAKKYNKKAIDLVESKRQSNFAQISTGVMEALYEAYEQRISYLLSEKKHDDAFTASELLKGRFLADKISNNPLTRKVSVDEKIKPEIFSASLNLLEKPNDPVAVEKLSELQKGALFFEENKTEDALTKADQNLVSELDRSPIDSSSALISYAFTNEKSLTAFVWQKGKPLKAVSLDFSLDETRKLSIETSEKIKDFIFFKQDGKSVFDKLLKPLDLPPDVKHLIIIPDKSLWKIPFQALSEDGRTYLIENKLISYAPSVSILLNQLNNPKPNRQSFQVFANSLYKNFYLKFADAEARTLAAGFNVKPKLDAAISDFSANSDESDIIHFSMHAEVERDAPFNSFLAFKPAAQTDGRLTVEELLKMRLKKGSLIFLASCDTTNVFKGEGLVSLAWGMFGAGASTVISAQWEANDQSTTIFTRSFYRNLKKGLSSAEALQQTSVEMIRNKTGNLSEPYFWAEFTLDGDYR